MLKPGVLSPVDVAVKSDTGVDESGDAEWNRERRERTILAEEIQGLLVAHIPGQAAKDKQEKAQLMFDAFKTRSWTAVEDLSSQTLRHGLAFLRDKLEGQQAAADPPLGAPPDGVPFQTTDDDVPI
ncbi:MAG TPA: hypothetical protein VGX94_12695 [Terriglobia bacterium]|nr:hypothetical protein [Terriglobia bacterium]